MKVAMARYVDMKQRFYTLEILPNLFGEWLLVRSYGKYEKCSCRHLEIFSTMDEAKEAYKKIFRQKVKKGYRP